MRRGPNSKQESKTVLVGVLKSVNDRRILLKSGWYRIPIAFLPKRKFRYLAFYQPAVFGKRGKRIEYYARILRKKRTKRIRLLPKEKSHPRAHDDYLKIEFSWIKKLDRPIRNIIPRRVSFGFVSLKTLLSSKNILELYDVPPTEEIMRKGLNHLDVKTVQELGVSSGGRRYRIDLAVFCKNGRIAIECDNLKAHSSKAQRKKDKLKDVFLKRRGWRVVRLKERDIIEKPDNCFARVKKLVENFGGQR